MNSLSNLWVPHEKDAGAITKFNSTIVPTRFTMKSILDEPIGSHNHKKSSKLIKLMSIISIVLSIVMIYSSFSSSSSMTVMSHFRPDKHHHHKVNINGKKNIIMMVTDGMGPASLSLTRSFKQFSQDLSINDILTLDQHLIGSSRTRSSSSLVTDSAAGATAFSCGLKSYNGAIGVASDQSPCGTILEALKLQGYLTGLVVTTRITDATPAAFSSHVNYRWQEDLIAQQQLGESPLGRVVDLILGGGRIHFNGGRADGRNLIEENSNIWHYVGDRQQFDELSLGDNVTLPLLGLLADYDIPYEIDRDPKQYPSLAEQTKTALKALSKASEDSDQGFFLLIEGSRIDHAGHLNDPTAQVREVMAFDEAFKEVIQFIDESDVETVAISTSDHETGGLVTARQIDENYPDYLWYPEILLNSKHSGEYLSAKILTNKQNLEISKFNDFLTGVLQNDMGLKDFTKEEFEAIKQCDDGAQLMYILNNMISIRSRTGWTTHGHSAVDVNIYGYTNSPAIKQKLYSHKENVGLLGNHENIEIGKFMANITGVDFSEITKLVKDIDHNPIQAEALEKISVDKYHQF